MDPFSPDQEPAASTCQLVLLELVSIFWCTYNSKLRPQFLVVSDLQEVTKKATVIIVIIITESDGALVIEFCSHERSLKNRCCLSLPVLNLLIIKQTFLSLFYCVLLFLVFFLASSHFWRRNVSLHPSACPCRHQDLYGPYGWITDQIFTMDIRSLEIQSNHYSNSYSHSRNMHIFSPTVLELFFEFFYQWSDGSLRRPNTSKSYLELV